MNLSDNEITIDFPHNWIPAFTDSLPVLDFDLVDCFNKQIGRNMSIDIDSDGNGLASVRVIINAKEKAVFRFLANSDMANSSENKVEGSAKGREVISINSSWEYSIRLRYYIHSNSIFKRKNGRLKWFELRSSTLDPKNS